MISTVRGMDVIHVSNRMEAISALREVEENTCLERKEIADVVSLRIYNTFTRGEEAKNAKTFLRAA